MHSHHLQALVLPHQQAQTPGLDILTLTRLKIQSEISAYNQMDLLDRDGNPLEWWKKKVYFSHV